MAFLATNLASLLMAFFFLAAEASRTGMIRMSSTHKLPPGRRGKWPLFGDTFQLIDPKTMASYQVKTRERYGDIWKTSIFFTPTIFVTGAENLKSTFVEEAKKKTSSFFPPHHKKLFGESSLLVQSGAYHTKLRRAIQKALAPQVIAQLDTQITKMANDFVLECKREPGTFKFVDKCRQFFIRLAVAVLLGNDISAQDLGDLASDITVWSKGLVSAPLTFIPWSTASRALRARRRVAKKLSAIIESYRAAQSGAEKIADNNLLYQLVTTKDEVDADCLSTDAIVDNIFTLIFAGSDTTASTLTSIMKTLSEEPAREQALHSAAAGDEKEQLVDALIKEVLSRYPPAPFSMRLVGDQPLIIGDYEVPSNWLVAYGYAGTLLGDSSASTSALPKSENHLAFGGGPRMCPGRFLALAELKVLLPTVLGENGFKWSLESNQNLEQTYTPGYFPTDGLLMKIFAA